MAAEVSTNGAAPATVRYRAATVAAAAPPPSRLLRRVKGLLFALLAVACVCVVEALRPHHAPTVAARGLVVWPNGTRVLRAASGRHAVLISGALRAPHRVAELLSLFTSGSGAGVDVFAALGVSPAYPEFIAAFEALAARSPSVVAYSISVQVGRSEEAGLVDATPSYPYYPSGTKPPKSSHGALIPLHYHNLARAAGMMDAAAAAAGIAYDFVGHARPDVGLFDPPHIDLDAFATLVRSRPRAVDSACLERAVDGACLARGGSCLERAPEDALQLAHCEVLFTCDAALRPSATEPVPALGVTPDFPPTAWAYLRPAHPAPLVPGTVAAVALFQPQQFRYDGLNDQVLWGSADALRAVTRTLSQLEGLYEDGVTFSNAEPEILLQFSVLRSIAGLPAFREPPLLAGSVHRASAYLELTAVNITYCLYAGDGEPRCTIDYWERPFDMRPP